MPAPSVRRLSPPRLRLVLPRFRGLDDDGGMGDAGDDGGDGTGIMLPVFAPEQQPATNPVPANGPLGTVSGFGQVYFNDLAVTGFMDQRFTLIPNNPNPRSCDQLTPPQPDGDVHSTGSNAINYDPGLGVRTGFLLAGVTSEGTLPGPGGNAPALHQLQTRQAQSEAGLLAAIQVLGGRIVADAVYQGESAAALTRIYTGGSSYLSGNTGYFVDGFMNTIGCPSAMTFTYANRYRLIDNPTVFGDPAKTQHITAFVPDGLGGGTYLGAVSRLRISFISPTDTASWFLTWHVIPDNGDPAYDLTWSRNVTVVPGAYTELIVEFPPITAAVVQLTGTDLRFNRELSEDWNARRTGTTFTLGASGAWPDAPRVGPGDTWDDFANYPDTGLPSLYNLLTGYWPQPGSFSSLNGDNCGDDFEGYAAGTILTLNRGTGWPTVGGAGSFFIYQAWDDFGAYAAGALALLPLSQDDFNRWPADGTFLTVSYTQAWDDFGAYAAGPIANLPVPADPANHWSAPGTFL